MVPLVEDQIHRHYVEIEEQRCRQLEAKYAKNPKTRGKKVKRREIPKPWTRSGPHALCQDPEFLILVDEYDYKLSDAGFVQYCASRGVLHVAGEAGSVRWRFFRDHRKNQKQFMAEPFFRFAEEHGGKRYQYTAEEMETHWKIILLGRAVLQDAWELYAKERDTRQPKLPKTQRPSARSRATKAPARRPQQGRLPF